MELITVSIVTPSYNQGRFLAETIESVLNQDGEFHIDYIVMDGASTDDSVDIIKYYKDLIDRGKWQINCRSVNFRWVSEQDRGQSEALNKGFALAKGNIFAWLNSDDTYHAGAVSKAIELFRQHQEYGLVYGKAHFTNENGDLVGEVETGPTDYNGLATLNLICQPSTFFKKDIWDAVNGVDPELIYTMDHDLWIRITREFKSGYIDEFLATYRLHKESKTVDAQNAVKFQAEILQTLIKHYNWAPANRVYGYCQSLVIARAPRFKANISLLCAFSIILLTIIKYLQLNKRIRFADLKMLNKKNMHKVWSRLSEVSQERF